MNIGMYQAAAAMSATERWQEVIASNLAASNLPGFKKQEVSFAAVQAGLVPPMAGTFSGAAQPTVLPQSRVATNFLPGELKPTGVNTDVAIEGPGFFEVQLPTGRTAYTRVGEFHLNASGQLVTKEGYLVLSDAGPIQLDLNNPAPMTISPTGEVSQGIDQKGRLRVVEFDDPRALTALSAAYFAADGTGAFPKPAVASSVRQGFVEGANTSTVLEMANLLAAMRTFEAGQRVLQLHDDRLGRTITELGQPS
jgi:flagellar basal body rod protein FlgG